MIGYSQFRETLKSYSSYVNRLPLTERQIYDYYVVRGMNQKEIAKILNMTQGGISSRVKRLLRRIDFLKRLEVYDILSIDQDLSSLFNIFEIELLKGMLETTNQSETARRLNVLFNLQGNRAMNQIKVRYRFNKYLEKLKDTKYYDLFMLIYNNLYMLHEVKLPHFNTI